MGNTESLIKCLEPDKLRLNEPMSAHTTLAVGGLADLFYTTENSGDLVKAIRLSRSFKVPVTVIGEGSGVVVADSGVRGLVVRNKSERVQIKPQKSIIDFFRKRQVKKAEVVIDSGVDIGRAIDKLLSLGIMGLEKYASHSGSVGAMVSRGDGKELLRRLSVIDSHGGVRSVKVGKDIGDSIITDATFLLNYGETKKIASDVSLEKKKKGKLAMISGEVFENIAEEERKTLGYPTSSVGYIIGEILNMKEFKMGKMMVSPDNQNVIVNLGGGKASDFIALVEEIKSRARESIGLELLEKVVRLGEF